MSTKEKIYSMIDTFDEKQLQQVLAMLEGVRKLIDDTADDAFCLRLAEDYENNSDADKHETVSLEQLAEELGVDLNELTA